MNNYDKAMSERFYLVNENGPTKLTIEDQARKKYKIVIGSEIHCSCGGGRTEHCVHTIFALVRIFKVDELDPLVWQLSFIDREIQQILEGRDKALIRGLNPYRVNALGGERTAAQRILHMEAQRSVDAANQRLLGINELIGDEINQMKAAQKRPEVA